MRRPKLAVQVGMRGAVLRADWIPRLENEEADALTNWEFHHINPANRVEVDLDKLSFKVMNILLEAGEDYVTEVNALKAKDRLRREAEKGQGVKSRKAKGQTLGARDPW